MGAMVDAMAKIWDHPEPTVEQLRRGLSLALKMLEPHEPPDSRAVSDEFVALAVLESGDASDVVMAVIDAALIPVCQRCGQPIADGKDHIANYGEPPGYDAPSLRAGLRK
jgi:hypothetical protein